MPDIQFPTSDVERLALLERIHQAATDRLAAGDDIIEQNVVDELAAFLATYKSTVNAAQTTLPHRVNAIKERRQATAELKTCINDFFVVLKRRIQRKHEPAALWRFYGIQSDGKLPDIWSSDELLEWGERIVRGDATAVEAGYPAMVNPSAQEVQTALEAAHPRVSNAIQADIAYDQAREAARTMRTQANDFIRRMNALLDYKLYDQERSSIRCIKRSFGFVYKYRAGETRDPNDLPDVDSDELTPVE